MSLLEYLLSLSQTADVEDTKISYIIYSKPLLMFPDVPLLKRKLHSPAQHQKGREIYYLIPSSRICYKMACQRAMWMSNCGTGGRGDLGT